MKKEWWILCPKALYKNRISAIIPYVFNKDAMLYEYVIAICVFDSKKSDEDINLYRIIYSPNG